MRVADYVIKFIEKLGVADIFLVSGGGNMHLIDAVGRNKNIKYICNHHEQACTIAAEGYSRLKNDIGVAIVTTGPGGTNAITGVAGAWLDSIPMLIISGQVKTEDMRENSQTIHSIRQFGDQELNIIDIVKPITKYSIVINDKNMIKYHLKKAISLAKGGRPGPVWIDIPLDIQASSINENELEDFIYKPKTYNMINEIDEIAQSILKAERPIIIAGNGIRLAKAEQIFLNLIDLLQIPVVTAINGNDLVNDDFGYYVGRFGIQGQRGANFAVQNSDLIISIGSRLCLRQIGFNYEKFAPNAKKIVIDIDEAELEKKSIQADLLIECDAKTIIQGLIDYYINKKLDMNIHQWQKYCKKVHREYNNIEKTHENQESYVNSYYFIKKLSKYLTRNDHVITSNGTSNVSTLFSIELKKGQRLFTNTGLASMGYGLPAAIGACVANMSKQVICMENDGSLQMNLQELQTIVHYQLPIKLFVFNNDGYLSIKITQKNNFPDNITAANPESGVSCPDLKKIAYAYEIPFYRISNKSDIDLIIKSVMEGDGYCICEVMMDPWQELTPKVIAKKLEDGSMESSSIEDMFPFLCRDEYFENIIK